MNQLFCCHICLFLFCLSLVFCQVNSSKLVWITRHRLKMNYGNLGHENRRNVKVTWGMMDIKNHKIESALPSYLVKENHDIFDKTFALLHQDVLGNKWLSSFYTTSWSFHIWPPTMLLKITTQSPFYKIEPLRINRSLVPSVKIEMSRLRTSTVLVIIKYNQYSSISWQRSRLQQIIPPSAPFRSDVGMSCICLFFSFISMNKKIMDVLCSLKLKHQTNWSWKKWNVSCCTV